MYIEHHRIIIITWTVVVDNVSNVTNVISFQNILKSFFGQYSWDLIYSLQAASSLESFILKKRFSAIDTRDDYTVWCPFDVFNFQGMWLLITKEINFLYFLLLVTLVQQDMQSRNIYTWNSRKQPFMKLREWVRKYAKYKINSFML